MEILEYHTTAYLNNYGNADSSVTVELGAAQINRNYYDAMQNDTLSQNYSRIGNDLVLNSQQRSYYTGQDLDSIKQSDANGKVQFKSIWSNGNIIVDSSYQGGNLWVAHTYTYDNTIHPGWRQYDGTKNMLISFTQIFFNPSQIDPVETLTYTYDAANRVQTLTRLRGGIVYAKQFFTYY